MKTNDILLLVALIGGAYLAYRYFGPGSASSPTSTVSVDPQTGQIIYTGPAFQQAAPITGTSLRDEIALRSEGNAFKDSEGSMIPEHWNYYYNQIKGTVMWAPDFEKAFPVSVQQNFITLDEYMAALSSAGLSGLGAIVPSHTIQSLQGGYYA